jgi:hypothetical protein
MVEKFAIVEAVCTELSQEMFHARTHIHNAHSVAKVLELEA